MKPIRVTDAFKEQALAAFQQTLAGYTVADGDLSFKMAPPTTATGDVPKPTIRMTATAYLKMMGFILDYSEECAWHGTVNRLSDTEFEITDILVYPQLTSAATVDQDDDRYIQWLIQQDDDTVNAMHFQGHSHVNMGVSPSGVDNDHRNRILHGIAEDSYYIFCIANKKSEINWWIYDMATNWIYEPKDITFFVALPDGTSIKTWVTDNTTAQVKKKTTVTTSHANTGRYSGNYTNFGTRAGLTACDPPKDNVTYYDGYGNKTSQMTTTYTGYWDEMLDDSELDMSKEFVAGYRWSALRDCWVRELTDNEYYARKDRAASALKPPKKTPANKGGKKRGSK